MQQLTGKEHELTGSWEASELGSTFSRLTPLQWLICGVAALGFAFDLYETLVLPLIVRPALTALGNFKPGSPSFNLWVGLLFYLPLASGVSLGSWEATSPIS